jgi:hypothetical protein
MNLVKNVFWSFAPLLLSFVIYVMWEMLFAYFRNHFDFPWGDEGQNFSATTWKELSIFNGVQFIFITALFLATLYVYDWFSSKASVLGNHRWWHLFLMTVSWIIYCYLAFAMATFTCCPGFLPDVHNEWYWLTLPEFIAFYILGQIYLTTKIVKSVNVKN